MFKKFTSMMTAAILLATGLGVVLAPTSFATVYASNAGSASGQTQLLITPASNGDVIIPAGANSVNISLTYRITTPSDFNGSLLNFTSLVKDPSNATITNSSAASAGYTFNSSGSYKTTNNGMTSNLNSNGATLSGSLTYLEVNVYLNLYAMSGTIPAGTYNFTSSLTKNGSTYTPSNGEVTTNGNLFFKNRSFTIPGGTVNNVLHNLVVCINRSLVTSSDTLTMHVVTSGNTTVEQTRFLRPTMNTTTSLGTSTTLSLASVSLTSTLAAAASLTFNSTTAGDTLTTDLSVTKGDGTEVSTDCAPAAISAPTVAFTTSTQLTASFNVSTSDGFGQCKLFNSNDLNTILRTTYSGPPGSGTSRTCVFNGLTQGTSYAVKASEMFYFSYMDNQNNLYFNLNREFLSPDSNASSAIISGSAPAPSTPSQTPEQIAVAAAVAARAAADAAAAVRAAEIATAQNTLATALKSDKAGSISDFKAANINVTTAGSLARINAEVLKLSAADRADFAKIKAIADKIEFDESFFNATARPTVATYNAYGVTVTDRTVATINAKVLELPVAKRADVTAIAEIAKVETFVDRVANPATRLSVPAATLVSKGLLSADSPYKYSVVQGLAMYPEGSLNSMAKIEAAIKAEIDKAGARKAKTEAIKAKIAARKK